MAAGDVVADRLVGSSGWLMGAGSQEAARCYTPGAEPQQHQRCFWGFCLCTPKHKVLHVRRFMGAKIISLSLRSKFHRQNQSPIPQNRSHHHNLVSILSATDRIIATNLPLRRPFANS